MSDPIRPRTMAGMDLYQHGRPTHGFLEAILAIEDEATRLVVRRVENLARYWDGAGGDPAAAQQVRAAVAEEDAQ